MLQHEHIGVPAPTFPSIDTSVFTGYATTAYSGSGNCNNCYIPAGMNPKFTNGQINGVHAHSSPKQRDLHWEHDHHRRDREPDRSFGYRSSMRAPTRSASPATSRRLRSIR